MPVVFWVTRPSTGTWQSKHLAEAASGSACDILTPVS